MNFDEDENNTILGDSTLNLMPSPGLSQEYERNTGGETAPQSQKGSNTSLWRQPLGPIIADKFEKSFRGNMAGKTQQQVPPQQDKKNPLIEYEIKDRDAYLDAQAKERARQRENNTTSSVQYGIPQQQRSRSSSSPVFRSMNSAQVEAYEKAMSIINNLPYGIPGDRGKRKSMIQAASALMSFAGAGMGTHGQKTESSGPLNHRGARDEEGGLRKRPGGPKSRSEQLKEEMDVMGSAAKVYKMLYPNDKDEYGKPSGPGFNQWIQPSLKRNGLPSWSNNPSQQGVGPQAPTNPGPNEDPDARFWK